MDLYRRKAEDLQASLSSLTLESKEEDGATDKILLEKTLSPRTFSRFSVNDIVRRSWKTQSRVRIEKIEDRVFKFSFEKQVDRDYIFDRRPWSLDGIHLILKTWPANKAIQEISFSSSTFYLQIHGLPPNLMHENNARRIGRMVGELHESSVNRKSVVGNRYIRIRVDIRVDDPIPAGFFQNKERGEDLWVQFKWERLPDFCYKCGLLTHVTGKCSFAEPARATFGNGISFKLYGPWLRAEFKGATLSINTPDEIHRNRMVEAIGDFNQQNRGVGSRESDNVDFGTNLTSSSLPVLAQHASSGSKDDSDSRYKNAIAMNPNLEALIFTLTRQSLIDETDLRRKVLDFLNGQANQEEKLTSWACEMLNYIGSTKEVENLNLAAIDEDLGPQRLALNNSSPSCST